MIVVDTNIIGYFFLTSDRSHQAEQLFRKDSAWCAPLLWRSEFRNVLVGYIRKGILYPEDAFQVMDAAIKMMKHREYEVFSYNVFQLAASSTCSAYDCEFVALARDLNLPLITIDKQILDQFPEIAVALEKFVL